jgi:hypothetical protein
VTGDRSRLYHLDHGAGLTSTSYTFTVSATNERHRSASSPSNADPNDCRGADRAARR